MTNKNGYLEGNGYIITWAFGHLFSLCDIEDYTGGDPSARWTLENLPCFPEKFRFELKRAEGKSDKREVDYGVAKQFKILEKLFVGKSRGGICAIQDGLHIIDIVFDFLGVQLGGFRKLAAQLTDHQAGGNDEFYPAQQIIV